MSVCLSVCLLTHLTYGASVRPEKAVMYSAGKEGLKVCGDLPETIANMLIIPTYPHSAFSA